MDIGNLDYQKYIDFTNSEEYIALSDYYNQETYLDVLGVSRQENPHSSFLRWLFDPQSNHGLGDYPLKKLIEAACSSYKRNHDLLEKNKYFQKTKNFFFSETGTPELMSDSDDFRITDVIVSREERIEVNGSQKGRADIWIEFAHRGSGLKYSILIENKVHSSENGTREKAQTADYDEILDVEAEKYKALDKMMFLYLTPQESETVKQELTAQISKKAKRTSLCESTEFLPITYQDIMDHVLEPCSRKEKNAVAERLISDYIRCLGKAARDTSDIVMAVSKKEKRLVKGLWDNHKDVLKALFSSMTEMTFEPELGEIPFYCSIANALSILKGAPGYEFSEQENELIASAKLFTNKSISRTTFIYEGKTYSSGNRGEAAIAFLGRLLLIEYVDLDKNKGKSIKEIRKDLLADKSFSNSDWHREYLITQVEFNNLRDNHCPLPTSSGYAAVHDATCPLQPKYRKKDKMPELIPSGMNNCPLFSRMGNALDITDKYLELAKNYQSIKFESCCIEDAKNVFYHEERNKENGFNPVETHNGDNYYVARFWGAYEVRAFAKLLGYTCKEKNGTVEIIRPDSATKA